LVVKSKYYFDGNLNVFISKFDTKIQPHYVIGESDLEYFKFIVKQISARNNNIVKMNLANFLDDCDENNSIIRYLRHGTATILILFRQTDYELDVVFICY
ncbi:MAG TPA: hypothetical protein VLO11_06685, partial [Luteolibacter sp.]|nr:hypothetical protein [Luteolibacter sp.]